MAISTDDLRRALAELRDGLSGCLPHERLQVGGSVLARLAPYDSLSIIPFTPPGSSLPAPEEVYLVRYTYDDMVRYQSHGYIDQDPTIAEALKGTGCGLHLSRILPARELDRCAFGEFVSSIGMRHGAASLEYLGDGSALPVSLWREPHHPDFTELETRLVVALTRALSRSYAEARLAAHLAKTNDVSAGGTPLGPAAQGVIVLSPPGVVVAADPGGRQLLPALELPDLVMAASHGLPVLLPLTQARDWVHVTFVALTTGDRAALLRPASPAERAQAELHRAGVSPRGREVALLVANGATNPQVAARLGISRETVKTHLAEVLRRTGCPDRFALALRLFGPPV